MTNHSFVGELSAYNFSSISKIFIQFCWGLTRKEILVYMAYLRGIYGIFHISETSTNLEVDAFIEPHENLIFEAVVN